MFEMLPKHYLNFIGKNIRSILILPERHTELSHEAKPQGVMRQALPDSIPMQKYPLREMKGHLPHNIDLLLSLVIFPFRHM